RVALNGPKRVRRGRTITYRVVLRNRGKASARRVMVTQRVPRALRLKTRSRRVSYARAKGIVKWSAGTLRPGQRKVLVLRYRLPNAATWRIVARANAKGANTNRKSARRITRVRR
ncbi:MAG: DUF11 domain-containing protein, partial [Thermoleophilia bacterium]|nr:DUF11 domain-containing protein [Thermoleophilia bacterium]